MASKFDKAVSRARGEDPGTALAVKDLKGESLDAFGSLGAGDIARRLALGAKAPVQLYTVEEGSVVCIIVEKKGEMTKLPKMGGKEGEMSDVGTWIWTLLKPGEPTKDGEPTWERGPRVSHLDDAQLSRMLPELIGRVCMLGRGGKGKSKRGLPFNEWFPIEVPVRNIKSNPIVEIPVGDPE